MAPSAPASPASFADSSVQGTSGQGALAAPLALPENTENPSEVTTTTIIYTYDPANRLTGAAYSSGVSFQYEYDPAGNRLSQVVDLGLGPLETVYQYDAANRLTQVDGAVYTWDDNGNLLSDGTHTYTYDHANRLKTVNNGQHTYSYGYNGLGERLQQSVDGVATHYTLDLSRGLTQVLSDGERAAGCR